MSDPRRAPLLAWYDRHRRLLPWRERPTPYRVWVSEIMLQQTQAAAVIAHYARFLRRFPDIASLARASEGEVLRHWAGLGYYCRARNLRAAARLVVGRHGGRFPDDPQAVSALPGVGRYTAGAILSIAFGKPAAVVDGNVARVFSRWFALRGDPKSSRSLKRAWDLAEEAVHRERPGDWNQALMELGALVCVPETPRCADCPVMDWCEARRRGLEERLPERGERRPHVDLAWKALWLEKAGRVLLWRRADNERFLPGHWALPELRHLLGRATPVTPLGSVRHSITRHRISLALWSGRLRGGLPGAARWAPRARLGDFLVSSLWRKAVALTRSTAFQAA